MKSCKRFVSAAIVGLAVSAVPAFASSISAIEAAGSGVQTMDSGVVTAILSQPGTFNGKSYTNYAVLANDGTGSLDIFGSLSGLGYTPTIGDAITATGTYAPYNQIPELGTVTAISAISSGNSVPAPVTATISQLNGATLPLSLAGYEITLNNVTISGSGMVGKTFGITNLTGTITDATGSETLYYWPTSYSAGNVNLFGQTVPTGLVNITGIADNYGGTSPEFIPMSITAAPEPASMALLAFGGLLILPRREHA